LLPCGLPQVEGGQAGDELGGGGGEQAEKGGGALVTAR
jgi:hypothetical protein